MKKLTILVIEDNPIFQKIISSYILDSENYCIIKSNGQEALEYLKENKNTYPDLIITDIGMPIMDGLTFCKQLRKFDFKTPIIIVTTDEENHNEEKYKKNKLCYLNISHFIPKIGPLDNLKDIIKLYSKKNIIRQINFQEQYT